MPPVKIKEDTWKPSELEKHLRPAKDDKTSQGRSRHHGGDEDKERREKKHRDGSERKHRDDGEKRHRDDGDKKHRDENEKKHRDDTDRRHRDDDRKHRDSERKHRDDDRKPRDDDRKHRDDERRRRDENDKEKSRTKSREPREGEKTSSSKLRDEDDDERRRRREERKRREAEESGLGDREHRKHRDERDADGKKHRDRDEGEKKRDRDKDRDRDRDRNRDDRKERHRSKDDSDSKSRRRDEKDQPRDEDAERRHRRHKEDDDERKPRKHRDREDESERKDGDEKKRRRHKDDDESVEKERKPRKSEKSDKEERKKKHAEPEEKTYSNDYADDFEAYEDDFEDAPPESDSNAEEEEEEKEEIISRREAVGKSKKQETSNKEKTRPLGQGNSEMDEILRALDEENKRLLDSSPILERKDEEERRSTKKRKEASSSSSDRRSFINFVSAKQRTVTSKTSQRMRTRAEYLLKLIELDSMSFTLFEQHSEREYDRFIRVFARTNGTQAYVQTNDDNIDAEIQTEQITLREKWSQHPPEPGISGASGGDHDETETDKREQMINKVPWDIALEKGIQVIENLLEENNMEKMHKNVGHKQSNIIVSEAFVDFTMPSILNGRCVTFSQFSSDHNHLLLAAYSKPKEQIDESNPISRKGVVCVWNVFDPTKPQKILICPSQPKSCCFSPNKPTLAFAGLDDGVVVLWDLREPSHQHKSIVYDNEEYILRNPTYNTAMPYMYDSHNSPVIRITPILSNVNKGSSSSDSTAEECLSYQLASLEQNSVMVLWVVVELARPEPVGSASDFGLRDRGRVKLVKSSVMKLEDPKRIRISGLETTFESTDLQVWPQDNSHLVIGTTSSGCVLHASRFGNRLSPKTFRPKIDYPFEVTSVDFSPFLHSVFLAGGSDGSLRLFQMDLTNPLITWQDAAEGRSVRLVRWCRSRPSVFFVLDEDSCIHIWDLHMDDCGALKKGKIANNRVTSICLSNDHRATGLGLPDRPPQMVVFLENGVAEAHIIKKEFSALMPEEKRQFSAFIAKAIL